jgi:hypothetical protein
LFLALERGMASKSTGRFERSDVATAILAFTPALAAAAALALSAWLTTFAP